MRTVLKKRALVIISMQLKSQEQIKISELNHNNRDGYYGTLFFFSEPVLLIRIRIQICPMDPASECGSDPA